MRMVCRLRRFVQQPSPLWWHLAGAWEIPESPSDKEDEQEAAGASGGSSGTRLRLSDVVKGVDTHASWWRSQMLAGALSKYIDDDFLEWTNAKINRVVMYDEIEAGLVSASRTAMFAGDFGSAYASGRTPTAGASASDAVW